jgi:hypothetical protein
VDKPSPSIDMNELFEARKGWSKIYPYELQKIALCQDYSMHGTKHEQPADPTHIIVLLCSIICIFICIIFIGISICIFIALFVILFAFFCSIIPDIFFII